MFVVCGHKSGINKVYQYGLYETYKEAWDRLTFLMDENNPSMSRLSQSYYNKSGVYWIHELELGDHEIDCNKPTQVTNPYKIFNDLSSIFFSLKRNIEEEEPSLRASMIIFIDYKY